MSRWCHAAGSARRQAWCVAITSEVLDAESRLSRLYLSEWPAGSELGRRSFAEAKARLARAFVATYGMERGEEALAEAMAYAWAHFDEVVALSNPVGYLYRVGQSRSRTRRRPAVYPLPATVGMPEIEPALVAAVGALPERQRVCTLLVCAYEWTQAEVAELLGISASSVHQNLERGLRALRQRLGRIDD